MNTKLAALKICRLGVVQRQKIFSELGSASIEIQKSIDELDQLFPQLQLLPLRQWTKLWNELTLQSQDISGWDIINNKLELQKKSNTSYPELLHSILVEKIKAARK